MGRGVGAKADPGRERRDRAVSGRSTLVEILSASIPPDDAVVAIEDVQSLRLRHACVASFERGSTLGAQTLLTALRLVPHRLVIDGVRDEELPLLAQALPEIYGSLLVATARDPAAVVARFGRVIPAEAIAQSIDLIVHLEPDLRPQTTDPLYRNSGSLGERSLGPQSAPTRARRGWGDLSMPRAT